MSRIDAAPFAIAGTPEEAPSGANNGNGKPRAGEQTGRQDESLLLFAGMPLPNGNRPNNPCGFWSYGTGYFGTLATYRYMTTHPTIAQVRGIVRNTVVANPWSWEVRQDAGVPDWLYALVKDTLTPATILRYKQEAFRSLDYGRYSFEKVWQPVGGRWSIERLKPLAVDTTFVMVEKPGGRYAGLRYGGPDQWLNRRESLHVVYDGEAGQLYGKSRLENVREHAWTQWLDAATQLQWTCLKIAGKFAVIYTPSGDFDAGGGNMQTWRSLAIKVGKAMADVQSNGSIWVPRGAVPPVPTKEAYDFAKIPLVEIDVKDFGNHADAIKGFLERMRQMQELMFAGYLRSPRSGMESEHGSRADAEVHTDTDTTDGELIDADFAVAFNEQVVDDVLELNGGPKLRGAVRVVPSKMRDVHAAGDWKLIDHAFSNPDTAASAIENVDYDAVYERRNIPKREGRTVKIRATLEPDPDEKDPPGDEDEKDDDGGTGKTEEKPRE